MTLKELKQKCIDDNIPIVRDETLKFIVNLINTNNYQSLLELGSAYGYSSYSFKQQTNLKKITTIELNENNYLVAETILKNLNIDVISANAFDFIPSQKYDVIFFDACKSHQDILFDKYQHYLNANGTIIIDNMFLRKFDHQAKLTKNQIKLKKKINSFREWLLNLRDWKTIIYDIEDGFAVCSKK